MQTQNLQAAIAEQEKLQHVTEANSAATEKFTQSLLNLQTAWEGLWRRLVEPVENKVTPLIDGATKKMESFSESLDHISWDKIDEALAAITGDRVVAFLDGARKFSEAVAKLAWDGIIAAVESLTAFLGRLLHWSAGDAPTGPQLSNDMDEDDRISTLPNPLNRAANAVMGIGRLRHDLNSRNAQLDQGMAVLTGEGHLSNDAAYHDARRGLRRERARPQSERERGRRTWPRAFSMDRSGAA